MMENTSICEHCGTHLSVREVEFNKELGETIPPRINYCDSCWNEYAHHAVTGE